MKFFEMFLKCSLYIVDFGKVVILRDYFVPGVSLKTKFIIRIPNLLSYPPTNFTSTNMIIISLSFFLFKYAIL